MNFLAHAYLSFGDPEVLTGNMISDYVKGKKKFDFAPRILGGIDLHRSIDEFTDNHPVTKEAAKYFKPAYGLYSSAFMDVTYDHFLAKEILLHGEQKFREFSADIYQKLERFEEVFPERFRTMFPLMKVHNWLLNYQFMWGIERSFQGLVSRAKYIDSSEAAMLVFMENYQLLSVAYKEFFPQLREYSLKKFADIH
ncbi:MAG: ACP phosphodiesterase [Flavitalea sp.]